MLYKKELVYRKTVLKTDTGDQAEDAKVLREQY